MTGSGQTSLQEHGVQPPAVLEADRGEPSSVDEAAVAVQSQGCRAVGVDDNNDDLANSRAGAVGQQGVEQPAADPQPTASGAT